MSRLVSFMLLAAIVAVAGVLFFWVMARFLLPVFLALVLTVVFRPLHLRLTKRFHGRARIAALATTLIALLAVLIPVLLILISAGREAVTLVRTLEQPEARDEFLEKFNDIRKTLKLYVEPNDLHIYHLNQSINALEPAVFSSSDLRDDAVDAVSGRLAKLERDQLAERKHGALRDIETALADFERAEEGQSGTRTTHVDTPGEESRQRRNQTELRREALAAIRVAYETLRLQESNDEPANELWFWIQVQANPEGEQLDMLRGRLQNWAGPLALSTTQVVGGYAVALLIGLAVMILAFYYFLADGPAMVTTVMRLSPLDDRYERQMIDQFDNISRAVVIATLLSAVVQGILAGVGYFFAGLQAIVLLTVVTALLAMVPFVGAAAVWGSCCIWLGLFEGRLLAAALLAAYGLLVVSLADNVIKPMVLRGRSNLHPLLALLSVIGGVQALGPIGIFVGPMAVAFLQALLSMLNVELESLTADGETTSVPDTG